MVSLALLPFALQAVTILIDEAYFHVRRGLPKWERIGHPIDTLSVLLCMFFALFVSYSPTMLKVYIALAILSSVMVTKDEFVHKHHCPASENWLHALLFTLHPITLTLVGMMWVMIHSVDVPAWMHLFLGNKDLLALFLKLQTGFMALFFLYQVVFWNIVWKEKPVIKM